MTQKNDRKFIFIKSNMLDLLSTYLTIFLLIPILYFTSLHAENIFSLILLILICVPTIMAMINGAPFVPTPMERVKKMVALAKIKPGQRVYDIGCGDGRFVYIAANNYGAKATGIELSPVVYLLAIVRKLFWKSKAQILLDDFKRRDLSDAEIIFCYLLPDSLKKIQPALDKKLKPGTKIFSYAFEIPGWKLIHREERNPKQNLAPLFVYEKV
jgi:SAM-dependent methyltransferase